MDQRSAYLVHVLEKIGSPLMSAITDVSVPDAPLTQEAQMMAVLLGKTVQASIDLGNVMDITGPESMDDSLRVALAALASPLVAGQYRKRGGVPEDMALKRIVGALQAVLTFSENFTPSAENIRRLRDLEAKGQITTDPNQTHIQYVQAFIPVVEAIATFPFGQAEQKLLMEVSERLTRKSVEMREILLQGAMEEDAQKRAELGLLKVLAEIYSAVHRGETDKIMKLPDSARGGVLSIEPVWQAFELRAAMLEALIGQMIPKARGQGGGSGGLAPAAVPAAVPPVDAAPVQAPPAIFQTPAQTPVQTPVQTPAQTPLAAASPLSMFAKKDTPETPAEPPPQTPAVPPIFSPPPSAPLPPPETPQAQEPQSGAPDDEPPSPPPSNPMGFFKKSE